MPIQEGDKIPAVTIKNTDMSDVTTDELFSGRNGRPLRGPRRVHADLLRAARPRLHRPGRRDQGRSSRRDPLPLRQRRVRDGRLGQGSRRRRRGPWSRTATATCEGPRPRDGRHGHRIRPPRPALRDGRRQRYGHEARRRRAHEVRSQRGRGDPRSALGDAIALRSTTATLPTRARARGESRNGQRRVRPLAPLIGTWRGDQGVNVSYDARAREVIEETYTEEMTFKVVGDVEWRADAGARLHHGGAAAGPTRSSIWYPGSGAVNVVAVERASFMVARMSTILAARARESRPGVSLNAKIETDWGCSRTRYRSRTMKCTRLRVVVHDRRRHVLLRRPARRSSLSAASRWTIRTRTRSPRV